MKPNEEELRRRERDRIFGDLLPEQTSDDVDADDDPVLADEWLRRQVPPHHGA